MPDPCSFHTDLVIAMKLPTVKASHSVTTGYVNVCTDAKLWFSLMYVIRHDIISLLFLKHFLNMLVAY